MRRDRRFVAALTTVLLAAAVMSGCGDSAAPTAPGAPVTSPVVLRIEPALIQASLVGSSGTTHTFDIAASVVITDTSGRGARLTKLRVIFTSQQSAQGITTSMSTASTVDLSLGITPAGSATYAHRTLAGFANDGSRVTLGIEATGEDDRGREFTAAAPGALITLPFPTGG